MNSIFNRLQEEFPDVEFSSEPIIEVSEMKVYKYLVVNGTTTKYRWDPEEFMERSILVNEELEARIIDEFVQEVKEGGIDEYK